MGFLIVLGKSPEVCGRLHASQQAQDIEQMHSA